MTDTAAARTNSTAIVEHADRRQRADARRNRAAILEAAEEMLSTQGLNAPIDEIAQRAGVGVGTVYRHFPTKEALLQAIVVGHVESLVEAAHEAGKASDAGEAFFSFLRRLADEFGAFKALSETMAAAGYDMNTAKEDVSRELMASVGQLLKRAQRARRVRPDVSVDDVRMLMTSVGQAGASAADQSARTRCVGLVCDALRRQARPH